jgi:hypothetical protein
MYEQTALPPRDLARVIIFSTLLGLESALIIEKNARKMTVHNADFRKFCRSAAKSN